jgi:F-type H+-transporting ATPase subunit b
MNRLENTKLIAVAVFGALFLAASPAMAAGGGEGGFPWTTWGVSIFNMLCFLAILYYFGWGKIQEHFGNRRESLVANLDAAKKLREEAEEKLAEYQSRLDALEDERQALLDEYHEQGEAEKRRIVEDAKQQVEKMRRDAEMIIQAETRRAVARLEQQAVDLAVGMATDKLKEAIDADIDTKIVERYVNDVRTIEAA